MTTATRTEPSLVTRTVARWTATVVSAALAFYALAWAVEGATRGLVV